MRNLRIFHNGKIATNSKPNFAEALAVENGKISSAGRNSDVLRLKKPDTEAIDLRGQTVIPGLNDSHLHITSHRSICDASDSPVQRTPTQRA